MAATQYAGRDIDVNEEGFLTDSSQWSPEVAEAIASEIGLSLSPEHWKVVTFCREDAAREGQPPGLRRITKLAGVEVKEMYRLFPKSPAKLAARVAGLPKPKGCV